MATESKSITLEVLRQLVEKHWSWMKSRGASFQLMSGAN